MFRNASVVYSVTFSKVDFPCITLTNIIILENLIVGPESDYHLVVKDGWNKTDGGPEGGGAGGEAGGRAGTHRPAPSLSNPWK